MQTDIQKTDGSATLRYGDGFGSWLRPLENFPPVFLVQSASGPEEWRHGFSKPFVTWEEASKLMRELHSLGFRARVIRETVVREIYEVPNNRDEARR